MIGIMKVYTPLLVLSIFLTILPILEHNLTCDLSLSNLVSSESEQEDDCSYSGSVCESVSHVLSTTNPKKRRQRDILTPRLLAAIDTCKISDRCAAQIVYAVMESLGHDPNDFSISRSSIQRIRKRMRNDIAAKLKENFDAELFRNCTVHWDGKILEGLARTVREDRCAVFVTRGDQEKLLGIPVIATGSGSNQANAVIKLCYVFRYYFDQHGKITWRLCTD